jgi:hypothetical protein
MAEYQLAEINIARMKGVTIDDPIMKEFVDNLDKVNEIAENSDGFVWRLKDEDNNATNFNPYIDEQIIVNFSIWESIETLEHYMYKTFHSEFLKRRKEWFQTFGQVSTAIWWVKKGEIPNLSEAMEKLDYLQKNGASEIVFNFKQKYPKPLY